MIGTTLARKYQALQQQLKQLGSLAVAFSGGVDSTLLLKVAHDVLGDKAAGLTVSSVFVPDADLIEAQAFCQAHGIDQVLVESDVLSVDGVADNPPDRCYLCKRALFTELKAQAAVRGFSHVADGGNLDDLDDYRPGRRAIEELGVLSPLAKAGFTKQDIRDLSRELGLSTWDKPSAACLASRIPYGTAITPEVLARVDKSEALLRSLGFVQCRVRVHGPVARIEVPPEQIAQLAAPRIANLIDRELRALGFSYVAVDLSGYRTGSLNEQLGITHR